MQRKVKAQTPDIRMIQRRSNTDSELTTSTIRRKTTTNTSSKGSHGTPSSKATLDERKQQLAGQFPNLFHTNTSARNFKYKVQYKSNMETTQQTARPVPIHVQSAVEAEVEKLL